MSPEIKKALQLVADNVFWVFLALMIILGSALQTPLVNVGLTAR
jgi:TRAP-type C4-dicarboxylate transport system permease small subunit